MSRCRQWHQRHQRIPPITWNNPNDANFPTNSVFQQGYVQHLINSWGASTNGGVRYYLMDNEHSIWYSTHQDVHPIGPTMQEIWTNMLDLRQHGEIQRSQRAGAWPGRMGLERVFLQRLRPAMVRQHKDYNPAIIPTAKPTAAGITCPGC